MSGTLWQGIAAAALVFLIEGFESLMRRLFPDRSRALYWSAKVAFGLPLTIGLLWLGQFRGDELSIRPILVGGCLAAAYIVWRYGEDEDDTGGGTGGGTGDGTGGGDSRGGQA